MSKETKLLVAYLVSSAVAQKLAKLWRAERKRNKNVRSG